jgi:hypothetical protein
MEKCVYQWKNDMTQWKEEDRIRKLWLDSVEKIEKYNNK